MSFIEGDNWTVLRRTLIVLAALGLAWLLVRLHDVVLLMFAAMLVGLVYATLGDLLHRHARLPRMLAVAVAFALVVGALITFFALFGQQLARQVAVAAELLPDALQRLAERVGLEIEPAAFDWQWLSGVMDEHGGLGRMLGYGASVAGLAASMLLVLFGGLFLATNPRLYLDGLAMLFTRSQQPLFHQAMADTGRALRQWLGGQVVLMLAVGLASWAAYAWLGLPSAATLALLAGLANFIPFIGPFLGAIPAVVVAATLDPQTLWLTLAAAVVIQQLESYALAPYVQKRAVRLPPFLGLFSIVVFGALFGLLGVVLAVPMAVAVLVLVQRLWVREALGQEVELAGGELEGEQDGHPAGPPPPALPGS